MSSILHTGTKRCKTKDDVELLDWKKVVIPENPGDNYTKFQVDFVKKVFGPKFHLLTKKLGDELRLKQIPRTLFCIDGQGYDEYITKRRDNRLDYVFERHFRPDPDEVVVMVEPTYIAPVYPRSDDYYGTGSGNDPIFVYL